MACAMYFCAACIPSGPSFHAITLPVAFVCGCHNSNDHCHCRCNASNLIRSWDLFVFIFFAARYLDPISASVCAPELWVCWGILGCRRIPLLNKNPAIVILIRSMGTSEEYLQSIRVALFLVFASRFASSAFLASVHHSSNMAHATIAVLNLGSQGLSWNWFLLAASARLSRIHFLNSGHRACCAILFPSNNRCPPFVKTKVTSHCSYVTVTFCNDLSATASVGCCDATSPVSTSSIGIWVWSRREKIRPFRLVRLVGFD